MTTVKPAAGVSGAKCPHLEGFDPLVTEQIGNPWPLLAEAREKVPVFYMPEYDMWCITRYEDAMQVYRDPVTFSNVGSHDMRVPVPKALAGEVPADYKFPFTGQLNTTDPPQHTRIKKLMQKGFTPRHVGEREGEIRELSDRLIAEMRKAGQETGAEDLTSAFASPLPIRVISGILGIPPERTDGFRDWAEDFFRLSGATDVPEGEATVRWRRMYHWDQYVRSFIAERRAEPRQDLTSDLMAARSDSGEPSLSDDELLANILGVVSAGADTTTILITHMTFLLLRHRDRWEEVQNDRSLIPNVVEETMRLMGPVRGLRRTVLSPVVIGGVELPVGSTLYLHVGSASRDSEVFENGDQFDLHRQNSNRHLGFGIQTHFCIGAPLARLEARVALASLLDGMSDLRLADEQALLDYTDNMVLPFPRQLAVEWPV